MDKSFLQSLHLIALGIVKNQMDPWELVNGWVEYYLKNKDKYMDHPNLKAVAVLKMKGLFIDHFRKSKNLTSTTTEERGERERERRGIRKRRRRRRRRRRRIRRRRRRRRRMRVAGAQSGSLQGTRQWRHSSVLGTNHARRAPTTHWVGGARKGRQKQG